METKIFGVRAGPDSEYGAVVVLHTVGKLPLTPLIDRLDQLGELAIVCRGSDESAAYEAIKGTKPLSEIEDPSEDLHDLISTC